MNLRRRICRMRNVALLLLPLWFSISAIVQADANEVSVAAGAPSVTVGYEIKDCSDCPPMIAVPQVGHSPEEPGKLLFVARHELTFHEYLVAVRQTGCTPPGTDPGVYYDISDPRIDDNHPLEGVTVADFQCYLEWIKRETGHTYRLPTPEEWGHFARAGTTTNFPWGDDIGFDNAIMLKHFDATKARQRQKEPRMYDPRGSVKFGIIYPVETFSPNAWGLYDIIGNVAEVVNRESRGSEDCIARRGVDHCRYIETRGGTSFQTVRDDFISRGQNSIKNNPSNGRGFRIVRD